MRLESWKMNPMCLTQSWNMNWGSTTQSKKMYGLVKFFNERCRHKNF